MIQCDPPVTPQPAQADPRAALALQLADELAKERVNVETVCRLGSAAYQRGLRAETDRAFDFAVRTLLGVMRNADAEAALAIENLIYTYFVKAIEDERHYERVFSMWRDEMAKLGRRFREPLADARDTRGVAFIFPSGVVLGHTEVLFRLLEDRDRALPVRICSLGACQPDFLARAEALGVPVDAFMQQGGFLDRLRWLRARLAAERIRTAVWVSAPTTAIFAFAMGVAPVQVMWTLRYHPVRLAEIDGYITYGSWGEESRVFHGQRWTVCPVPLALDPRTPPAEAVRALRAKFPQREIGRAHV